MRTSIPILLTAFALALPLSAEAAPKHCPPGLAKKSQACVPPGQAKKAGNPRWSRGDVISGDYVVVRDPGRYGLDRSGTYYNSGGYIFRVDQQTREVLDFLGAAAALLD
ncbi:excinuclease ABC subunit A [uncultured Roseobacter sp.]|uniref:excinuclease ABC subunit A n=1 Tax=uncultured Roseobacter sp. TaxID=114847 RepID=UPI0026129DED|nr:excinuclease ABC subunit A [uncultured Roseobacter sp.]